MLDHLLELRRRGLYVLCWFGALFFIFFYFAEDLYHFLMHPLLDSLPNHQGLIATQVTSSILTPLQLASDSALFFSIPFALFHLWLFASPGLYQQERASLKVALTLSFLLFIAGIAFCFYWVLPLMFHLFAGALPKEVHLMPEMAATLHFIMRMLLIFGFCFQLPIFCWLLARLKLVDALTLKKIRPYAIVLAFILGMLLTPPDVISQITLAIPLCFLYEIGILLATYLA